MSFEDHVTAPEPKAAQAVPSELLVEVCQFVLAVVFCWGGMALIYHSEIDPRGYRRLLFLPLLALAYPSGRLLARAIAGAPWRAKDGGAA